MNAKLFTWMKLDAWFKVLDTMLSLMEESTMQVSTLQLPSRLETLWRARLVPTTSLA